MVMACPGHSDKQSAQPMQREGSTAAGSSKSILTIALVSQESRAVHLAQAVDTHFL